MRRSDIAIAGGGPAGALAAILLARAGASVALVSLPPSPARIEGLSPRAGRLLADLELPSDGVGPALVRRTDWGGLSGAANREHLVDRTAFDSALLAAAAGAGARLVRARARRVSGAIEIDGAPPLRAPVIVEARGRRAPIGLGRLRGPASIAIAGFGGPAGRDGVAIAAKAEGWTWSADLADRGRWLQVVTHAAALRSGLAAAWAALAGDLPLPQRPQVRACELRLNAPELPPGTLVLGDAAVAMDPLSGHGLYWALSSALASVPIARAVIDGAPELAARFHRERVVATFWRQARIGRDFHRAAGRDGDFWSARASWPDAVPAHPVVGRPLLTRRVIVADGRLVEGEVLVTPQDPDGVAFVAGQAIAPVLARLGPHLPDAAAFHAHILPDAPPAIAALVHGWLASRGIGRQPDRPIQRQEVQP